MSKKIIEQYTKLAPAYDSRWKNYLAETKKSVIKLLNINKGEKVLDIGCGTGVLTEIAAQKVGHKGKVTGIDITPAMLQKAKKKLKKYSQIELKEADAHKLPFQNKTLDHVISISTLHYWEKPDKVIKEVHRVLKINGKLLILDWCSDFFWMYILNIVHKKHIQKIYSTQELYELLKPNFKSIKITKKKISLFWGIMIVTAVKK